MLRSTSVAWPQHVSSARNRGNYDELASNPREIQPYLRSPREENVLCGGLLFLALLAYLILAKPRRLAVALLLLMVMLFCVFNAVVVYFLL